MQCANSGPSAIKAATAALAILAALTCTAQGRKTYSDPGGAYSVMVPSGWEAQPQQGSPMVSIIDAKTKVSVTLGAMKGPAGQTPNAEAQLKNLEGQIQQGCGQEKIESRGATEVAGLKGVFVAVHCNGADGPEYMRLTAATGPGSVALIITASPGEVYLKELLPLEEIRSSFKVSTGTGAQAGGMGGRRARGGGQGMSSGQGMGGGPETGDGQGMGIGQGTGGGQAAMQGMNSGEGQGQGAGGGQFPAPGGGGNGAYHDPQGRYSLAIPSGWNTASDNGNLTLSSGATWVTVATGTGGQPGDENHQIVQQIQAQYKEFKVLNEGDFQNNGHASHGTNATGINPKGQRVSVLVVSISAGSGNYLVLISSAPNDQAQQINGTVMQIAGSVKFAGE